MRNALISLLIAATALTPLASATAARPDRSDRQQTRSEHQQQRPARQAQRGEQQQVRAQRPQVQAQRGERQQVRAQRPQVQAQRQQYRGPRGAERSFARTEQLRPSASRTRAAQYQPPRRGERQVRAERPARQRVQVNNIVAQPRQWADSRSGSNWDRNRSGNWNRDRSGEWNRDRSGSWDRNRGNYSRGHDWNRNWRNDSRYDWQRYRAANRYRYHLPLYYSPYRGYGYSRFSIGFFLEPLFYSSRYWIGDPWYYRLPPAYPGTQWVRYYDDALLVDVYTGEVIDVIHDFFW